MVEANNHGLSYVYPTVQMVFSQTIPDLFTPGISSVNNHRRHLAPLISFQEVKRDSKRSRADRFSVRRNELTWYFNFYGISRLRHPR
jgi:hypothetical protein